VSGEFSEAGVIVRGVKQGSLMSQIFSIFTVNILEQMMQVAMDDVACGGSVQNGAYRLKYVYYFLQLKKLLQKSNR